MRLDKLRKLIHDLPTSGPLEKYREQARFDWKSLRIKIEGEKTVETKAAIWKTLHNSPICQQPIKSPSLDAQRRLCHARIAAIWRDIINHPSDVGEYGWIDAMFQYDGSVPVKSSVSLSMVPGVLFTLGTERHMEFIDKIVEGEILGCFALTEIAHGTNVKCMRTKATYDLESQSFVLHSPDFEAAKCWVGALGKSATHAIVYAQLYLADGTCQGLHPFFVSLRDPKTMQALPGVVAGDLGEKIGLNGVDNGFVRFTNYRIPRESLLNKMGDVTPDGKYVTRLKDPSKRFGSSLGALSFGRVTICAMCSAYLTSAIVIAIRYSAARKQFGPNDKEEWPVIEYQSQQLRLFPCLAAAYAFRIFSSHFCDDSHDFRNNMISGENPDVAAAQGMEIHALSSAAKPLSAWTARDAIQDCRESCGGHGYLKVSRLGDLRNDNDANCTYEGESNVLLQQTSNWLLNQRSNVLEGKPVASPFGSIDFLPNFKNILRHKFDCSSMEDTMKPENLLKAFEWLVCYYLEKTADRVRELRANGEDSFSVRNNSQSYYARTLSLVYAEYNVVKVFLEKSRDPIFTVEESQVLTRLCSLYAGWSLERRLGDLYAGGYASPSSNIDGILRNGIIQRCQQLLPDVISLADAIAPPDFILNSPLGMSDGEIYKHLEESIFKNKENLEVPSWWKEIPLSKL